MGFVQNITARRSIANAAGAVLRATLYWWATTGEVPEGLRIEDLPEVQRAPQPGPISGNPYAV